MTLCKYIDITTVHRRKVDAITFSKLLQLSVRSKKLFLKKIEELFDVTIDSASIEYEYDPLGRIKKIIVDSKERYEVEVI